MIEDQLRYYDAVDAKFGGKDVSRFMLSHSLGALLSTKISFVREKWFKGMGLMTPSYRIAHLDMISKFIPVARMMHKLTPATKLCPFP